MVEGEEATPYVMDAIRLILDELRGGKAALIGFSGAPLTLACYMIEGLAPRVITPKAQGDDVRRGGDWHAFMEKVTESRSSGTCRPRCGRGRRWCSSSTPGWGILSPQDYARYN